VHNLGAGVPRQGILSNPLPLLLLCALASLYLSHFRLPSAPIWEPNDQWDVLKDPARMWEGDRIYRDFYEQTTPGTAVVDLLFFRMFGLKNWIPNLHEVLLGVGLTWLVVMISRKVFREERFLALLPGFLFLTFAFFPHMEDTHRWYSCAATLAALAVVMEARTSWRLAAVGVLAGLASFFTQTQGVFAVMGLIAFMVWEWRERNAPWQDLLQRTACLLAAFVATVLATDGYFIAKAGFERFLDCIIRIPVLYLSRDQGNTLHVYMSEMPGLSHWYNVPGLGRFLLIYALLPLVYLLFLARYRRGIANREKRIPLMLLNVMGLFLLASVAMAPSHFRLCTVSAPAFVILIYWIRGSVMVHRILAGSLWIAVLYLGVTGLLRTQASPVVYLQLPRGEMAFVQQTSGEYEMMRWLSSRTQPGDVFLATGQIGILFPLALRPVDEASGYDDTSVTRPEWVQNAVASLDKYRIRFIEWPPDRTDSRFYRAKEDNLAPLREYVERNYHLVKRFDGPAGDDLGEIWERNQ
jgi:hypothetical protein